nr:PEAK1 related, kinase-activating pseudokinase 1 [Rousettus aegyptiacus]
MYQAIRLNPKSPKMSACSDFVEHIWKPGSCKNCFCLRSDHQLSSGRHQPRAGSLPPPPRLSPRPEHCRLEDEGVNSSPYSKPTIAVKPTMLSSDASDVWTEANMNADVSKVIWRRPPGKLPLPKQEDMPVVYLGSFRGVQKPAGPSASADVHPHCPPAYAVVGLHSLEARGEHNAAFHAVSFPDEKAGRENKPVFSYQELNSTPESFLQKLAAFGGKTSGCHKGPGPYPSPQPPRESLPAEDDSGPRRSPSGDSEGGEYCSLLDCRPGSPGAEDTPQAEGPRHRHGGEGCSPAEEEKRVSSLPRECCGQGLTENSPHLGPKQLPLTSEAASSSDGLSCGTASSGTSSPFASHLESDYCSLMKEPVLGKQQDSGCHGATSNRCLGLTGEPQPTAHSRESVHPEPIYAESTKRKKAVPTPSRPQAAAAQGQVRTANTWAQKTTSGWGRDREGPDMAPKVAATITVMAAHPEEDHRTIYLSSPDSAVGVQWPRRPVSQDSEAGDEEPSDGQGMSSREGHRHDASEHMPKGRPAIPPKLSRSSPGGSPVSPSASPLSDVNEGSSVGSTGPQPSSRGPADPASCRANGVSDRDSVKCPVPASTASALDQRRPRYHAGAWSRQCRIEEEEEVEQDLLSQGWGRETENGTTDPSNSSTWHRLCPTDGSSGQNNKAITGMSKSASFAFEFPKDRSGIEAFSPPPPPPKSR